MMISSLTIKNDLPTQSRELGLHSANSVLNDLLARAIKQKWSLKQLLKELAHAGYSEKAARNLTRRLARAQLGRFAPLEDFDWNWPEKIDRGLIEKWFKLTPIAEARNLILIGRPRLGKTMILKNLAYQAVLAGHSVLFRPISKVIADMTCDSPLIFKRRLREYKRVDVLAIDDVGDRPYDANDANLLYEVVNCRSGSILMNTNFPFMKWKEIFPNATSILDRLLHRADVTLIKGNRFKKNSPNYRPNPISGGL